MEIKVNKDIQEYKANIYMGFNMRQFGWLLAAGAVCILIYFNTRKLGTNTSGWLCIVGAAPFVLMGFFNYHDLPFEKFIVMLVRNKIMTPQKLSWGSTNLYTTLVMEQLANIESEMLQKDAEERKQERLMAKMQKKTSGIETENITSQFGTRDINEENKEVEDEAE